ncbi:glycosyltransferase [bacterium]|nr:glycosyltransferase [candidate division CSSED10-310 bacterium]
MSDCESQEHSFAKPIRVVRIISGLWPGGVEKKLTALLPLLDRNRFRVSVVCLKKEGVLADSLRKKGIQVDVLPVSSRWSPSGLWRLSRFLKSEHVDIVHTHMYRSNVTGTIAAKIAGIPVVVSNIHNVSSWDSSRQMIADRFVSRIRDCTIFVADAVRRDYLSRIPLEKDYYKIIYNGIDTAYYCPSQKEPMEKENRLLTVGCAARLMPQKGLEFLVRAAAESEIQSAGIQFLIAGDGPLRQNLQDLATKLQVEKNVRILGFVQDTREFYRKLDVFAMPSLKEGFSNALLEAMACGVAPVATSVGGNPEAIQDGVSGLLVPPSDYNAFLSALKRLLSDSGLRHSIAAGSLRRAQSFSLNAMVRQTEDLYLTLHSKKAQ